MTPSDNGLQLTAASRWHLTGGVIERFTKAPRVLVVMLLVVIVLGLVFQPVAAFGGSGSSEQQAGTVGREALNATARSMTANAQLVESLEAFKAAVLAKIDSDVETTARAFWDAYDIQRSRRVADFVLAPLTVIEQAIGTLSFAKNIPEIFTSIERAENILQVVSLFMGLSQLNQVGQNLQVAIDGPAYSSLLKTMLTEAAASTQPGEYATTLKLYLYGIGGKRSPVGVPHRPVDGGEPKAEVLWGAEAVKRRISEDISRLVRELETKPVGSGVQVEAIRTHLSTLTQALKRSRADNVTVASGVILPASGAPPDLTLGGIGALEQVRREALTQYDHDLRLEQVSVLTSAVKAGTQAISLKVGYKTPGGNLLKEVQRDVIAPGTVLVNTLTRTYATSARYQVAALPHEMVLSLSGELAVTWKVVDEAVAAVRSLAGAPIVTAVAGSKTNPPRVYVDENACPFECCVYRKWIVKQVTPLFAEKDRTTKTIATLQPFQVVQARTGVVYTRPAKLEVLWDHGPFRKGEIVYVLTYQGEGMYKIWRRGEIISSDVPFPVDPPCDRPSPECWGTLDGRPESTWWVQIETPSGQVGWTDQPDHFGNKDACG